MILFNGCSSESQNEWNDFGVTPIYSVKGEVKYVALISKFKFNKDVNFIFDHDALSLYSYTAEDKKFVNSLDDLSVLRDSIQHTQFIVENLKNERRFFSEIIFFDGERFESKDVFKLDRAIDTLRLRRNQLGKVESIFIDVNRLKINENDSIIRLYYIYKPNEQEKKDGFSSIFLKSNWISLYPQ